MNLQGSKATYFTPPNNNKDRKGRQRKTSKLYIIQDDHLGKQQKRFSSQFFLGT